MAAGKTGRSLSRRKATGEFARVPTPDRHSVTRPLLPPGSCKAMVTPQPSTSTLVPACPIEDTPLRNPAKRGLAGAEPQASSPRTLGFFYPDALHITGPPVQEHYPEGTPAPFWLWIPTTSGTPGNPVTSGWDAPGASRGTDFWADFRRNVFLIFLFRQLDFQPKFN